MNDEYVQQLETKWRASQPKFTPDFLRATFPEAWSDTIPAKIKKLECNRDDLELEIRQILNRVETADSTTQMFVRECIKYFRIPELYEIERHVARLKRLLIVQEVGTKTMRRRVELAKEVPIVEIASSNGIKSRRSGKSQRARCAFHQDRRPSLHFYPESNSFYCFGCQKGGDVIQFVQDLLNLTFLEAVRYLTPSQ